MPLVRVVVLLPASVMVLVRVVALVLILEQV